MIRVLLGNMGIKINLPATYKKVIVFIEYQLGNPVLNINAISDFSLNEGKKNVFFFYSGFST